jgi:Gpi16 subunit, GPI transamidase component
MNLRLSASAVLQAHLHFQVEGALGSSHVLFPRVVNQLCAVTNVSELHLALTQGRWVSRIAQLRCFALPAGTQCKTYLNLAFPRINCDSLSQHASSWGRAPLPAAAAGAQLRARFHQGLSQEVRPRTLATSGTWLKRCLKQAWLSCRQAAVTYGTSLSHAG